MKANVFDDGEASPTKHTTSGSGYAAVTSSGGAFKAKVTGGRRYQALVADNNGGFSKTGSDIEPFEVELLSDVEGASEKKRPGSGADPGDVAPSENDAWMRNIWGAENRAVVMSYFCVGIALRFLATPISYYTVNVLGSSPAQQNVLITLGALPWSFKLVYGFISDNFPIRGKRRKPYFVIGWAVYVLVNLYIATKEVPSIQLLAGGALTSSMGFMLADVTTDAILVERSKHEPRETRGSMQAIGYSVRFIGSLLGSVLGMLLYNKDDWGWGLSIQQLFVLNGLVPIFFIGPFVQQLRETTVVSDGVPVRERLESQCREIFRALEQKAVFIPMGFVFIYNIFQVPNAAWRSFLVDGLGFKAYKLGILAVVGSLMASLGLLAYKRWFFHSSWRKIYVWTTLIVSFFSGIQVLLILRINKKFGIGDLTFAIGDDSIADFIASIQFLPIVQMYISMCPDGAEGTTYAILTTMTNVAQAAAFNLGTHFTSFWDVSNEALIAGNFTGMWKLTLLTSFIQPLPLLLIRYLPASQAQQRIHQASGARNRWGGIVLLTVLFSCLFWTISLSISEVFVK